MVYGVDFDKMSDPEFQTSIYSYRAESSSKNFSPCLIHWESFPDHFLTIHGSGASHFSAISQLGPDMRTEDE